jgi:DNA-binding transcriptional regulator YiaG
MKTNKKSPFTGGKVELCTEQATTLFRKERYAYTSYYYRCVDTGRCFTDNELDDKSLEQVYCQYRKRHGIPSQDEIKEIREQYGLSALTMARILGLGDNQYRLYEEGVIPSESVGKMIGLVRQKVNMLALLNASKEQISVKEYNRLFDMIKSAPAPIVLPVFAPLYSRQSFSEERSGQMISKKITKSNYYKTEDYAIASGFEQQ